MALLIIANLFCWPLWLWLTCESASESDCDMMRKEEKEEII
jgi:hypothetical protein